MNADSSSSAARTALLPLIVAILAACAGGEGEDSPPVEGLGGSAPAEPAQPVGQGSGGGMGEPGMTNTIDLRKIGYALGEEGAPVTVYEFSDFGCPFCGMFARGTFPALREEFVATGKVRWTYVPVTLGFPGGREGARAAECSAEQGKFWEMHDLLYENQNEWKGGPGPELASDYAGRIDLDADRFASCYREDRGAARTGVNNHAAGALRVRATPSFFINGRLVEGALPVEQFRQILGVMARDQ